MAVEPVLDVITLIDPRILWCPTSCAWASMPATVPTSESQSRQVGHVSGHHDAGALADAALIGIHVTKTPAPLGSTVVSAAGVPPPPPLSARVPCGRAGVSRTCGGSRRRRIAAVVADYADPSDTVKSA
jgi:hypothetical protein